MKNGRSFRGRAYRRYEGTMLLYTIKKIPKKLEAGRGSLAMLFSAALLYFVWHKTGIYFETNDDRYIASILSGVITGTPDAHVIYVNYLLALPLSLLYRFTTEVPWYGGMLVLFQCLACGVILDSAYTRCRRWFHLIPVTAVAMGVFIGYYYYAGLLQYTSTAALLAITGYVCLLLRKDKRTGLVWFVFFELLGYLLRSQAMLMLQPLGMAAVLAALAEERGILWKEKVREFLYVAAGVFLILCLGTTGNLIGYHGEAWDRYEQFNDTMTLLFDYYGKPDYEEVSDILEEHNVSREKYEAYCSYMILDWKVAKDCEERLGAYAAEKRRKPFETGKLIGQIYDNSLNFQWKISRLTLIAWGIFFLWMLINKRFRMLLGGVLFLGGARMAVWGYLIWRGRTPMRVTLPLLACEVMLLLSLIWLEWSGFDSKAHHRPKFWKTAVLLAGCGVFCMAGISSGRLESRYLRELNEGQRIFMKGLSEIQEYCESHPQNRYLIDANSLNSYKGSAFESSVYHPVNAVISGGWFSASPAIQGRLEDYLGEASGFYFLIYADGGQEDTPQFAYLVREMGGEPKFVEQWTASHGGSYSVYYFEGPFPFSQCEE